MLLAPASGRSYVRARVLRCVRACVRAYDRVRASPRPTGVQVRRPFRRISCPVRFLFLLRDPSVSLAGPVRSRSPTRGRASSGLRKETSFPAGGPLFFPKVSRPYAHTPNHPHKHIRTHPHLHTRAHRCLDDIRPFAAHCSRNPRQRQQRTRAVCGSDTLPEMCVPRLMSTGRLPRFSDVVCVRAKSTFFLRVKFAKNKQYDNVYDR